MKWVHTIEIQERQIDKYIEMLCLFAAVGGHNYNKMFVKTDFEVDLKGNMGTCKSGRNIQVLLHVNDSYLPDILLMAATGLFGVLLTIKIVSTKKKQTKKNKHKRLLWR